MNRVLKWNFQRRFGLEYEFTNSSFQLETMATVVSRKTGLEAKVRQYEHTRNNYNYWVCKTDSSCGIELVSPILKGPASLKIAAEILPELEQADFNIGDSCGQHVHVEIADFDQSQVGTLIAYWMKIERFILNGTPLHRRNQTMYTPMLTSFSARFNPNNHYSSEEIWNSGICSGRNAINLQNYSRSDSRGTIEFRFGEMTFDPEIIKNRVRFLIWFVEICKVLPHPSNLNWMNPKEIFTLFKLLPKDNGFFTYNYSPAVHSMRKWLLERHITFAPSTFGKSIEQSRQLLEEISQSEIIPDQE